MTIAEWGQSKLLAQGALCLIFEAPRYNGSALCQEHHRTWMTDRSLTNFAEWAIRARVALLIRAVAPA